MAMPTSSSVDALIHFRHSLVLFFMPFCYGAATRLPFIYFVIHLDSHFNMSWMDIGYCVAAYQFARVLTNVLSMFVPRISHVAGTVLGLAGFLIVLICDRDALLPFVAGTAVVGFSETMSSMQQYCKREYSHDLAHLQIKIKTQYASVMLGVTFAFLLGGVFYEFAHIDGVALFGVVVCSLELLSVIMYFWLSKSLPDVLSLPKHHFWEPAVAVAGPAHEDKVRCDTAFLTSGLKANWVAIALAVAVGVEAITIGYNLSVGPIFVLYMFGADTSTIGILFAAGAATGTVASISATILPVSRRFMNKHLPAPLNIYVSMIGIGCSVLIAAIPVLEIHILGLLLLMAFNDLATTLLVELMGSITSQRGYKFVGPLAQIIRRMLNTVTAITGPILFGWFPRAPHLVAGGVTLLTTLVMIIVLEHRRSKTCALLAAGLDASRYQSIKMMPWEQQEIAAQMLEAGSHPCAKEPQPDVVVRAI
eukprot:TRINITY_DN63145_c0_g1_i1.p1 TRINITY_DN63145_c0_g1~~TRINITY_DN63145_c0_g1_i1.p1  ORF type:complete len:477 (-),score=52.24 TRINITY_DN63145_c0_g1_i1:59-1489(-)